MFSVPIYLFFFIVLTFLFWLFFFFLIFTLSYQQNPVKQTLWCNNSACFGYKYPEAKLRFFILLSKQQTCVCFSTQRERDVLHIKAHQWVVNSFGPNTYCKHSAAAQTGGFGNIGRTWLRRNIVVLSWKPDEGPSTPEIRKIRLSPVVLQMTPLAFETSTLFFCWRADNAAK